MSPAATPLTCTGPTIAVKTSGGGEVWRFRDGLGWQQINSDGFGDSSNFEVLAMSEHDGSIYAGTWNSGGCEVWRTQVEIFADGFDKGDTAAWDVTVD